jgi:hypothetical protein
MNKVVIFMLVILGFSVCNAQEKKFERPTEEFYIRNSKNTTLINQYLSTLKSYQFKFGEATTSKVDRFATDAEVIDLQNYKENLKTYFLLTCEKITREKFQRMNGIYLPSNLVESGFQSCMIKIGLDSLEFDDLVQRKITFQNYWELKSKFSGTEWIKKYSEDAISFISNNFVKGGAEDPVALALNYSAGVPEGDLYFYPLDTSNGKCIYSSYKSDSGISAVIAEMGNLTGQRIPDEINLNKVDLKNVSFYKINGVNKDRYGRNIPYLKYETRVAGLPNLFQCDSEVCNSERLKRAWNLVAQTCKGTKKAF